MFVYVLAATFVLCDLVLVVASILSGVSCLIGCGVCCFVCCFGYCLRLLLVWWGI